MLIGTLVSKLIFPTLFGISAICVVKYIHQTEERIKNQDPTEFVYIVGKVSGNNNDKNLTEEKLMLNKKPNYLCNLSSNAKSDNKAFCLIEKITIDTNKFVESEYVHQNTNPIQNFSDLQDNNSYFRVVTDYAKINNFEYSSAQKIQVFLKDSETRIANIKILYTYRDKKDIESKTNLVIARVTNNLPNSIKIPADSKIKYIFDTPKDIQNNVLSFCDVYGHLEFSSLEKLKNAQINNSVFIQQNPALYLKKDHYVIIDLHKTVPIQKLKQSKIKLEVKSRNDSGKESFKELKALFHVEGYLTSSYQLSHEQQSFFKEKSAIFMNHI